MFSLLFHILSFRYLARLFPAEATEKKVTSQQLDLNFVLTVSPQGVLFRVEIS